MYIAVGSLACQCMRGEALGWSGLYALCTCSLQAHPQFTFISSDDDCGVNVLITGVTCHTVQCSVAGCTSTVLEASSQHLGYIATTFSQDTSQSCESHICRMDLCK